MIKNKFPIETGFYMPAEFSRHRATIFIWPQRPGSWPYNAKPAQKIFTDMILKVSQHELVYVLVNNSEFERVKAIFAGKNIKVLNILSNDSWVRDTGPTFLVDGKGGLAGVNWSFNAWGGDYDGLYKDYADDDKLASVFCEKIGIDCFDASPFVLEGGSIHSDGEGTLLVTKECLLSPGRNPDLSMDEIEQNLKNYLGAEKIIWLPCGIYNDETNGHVDNICAFINPGEVVLGWTDNKDDPQYELSKACLETLNNTTDARSRKIKVHKLPIPDVPVCITENDAQGYVYEEGEARRTVGERLAASYVNFYFANDIILLPQFGKENTASDKRAKEILSQLCPDREVIGIKARDLIVGGGNIHCLTQQIPQ